MMNCCWIMREESGQRPTFNVQQGSTTRAAGSWLPREATRQTPDRLAPPTNAGRSSAHNHPPRFCLPPCPRLALMPPQPGVFALPHSSTHRNRVANGLAENGEGPSIYHPSNLSAGPSRSHGALSLSITSVWAHAELEGTPIEDPKSRKRKELAGRPSREHFEG